MNWIEYLFGVSPDKGDGSTEALLLMVGLFVVIGITTWRNRKLRERLRSFLARRGQSDLT